MDDSEVALRAVAEVALAAGFEVVGAVTSGTEAVRLHAELEPDLVLVDLRMPEMNGYQVAEQIRAARPQTRVLLFSAVPPEGAVDVLPKRSLSPRLLRRLVEPSADS